jgi:hypothetical protein
LFTHLNRELAVRLTCEQSIDWLEPTDELVGSIIDICERESASLTGPDPEALQTLRKQLDVLTATIEFNRRNPGVSDEEQCPRSVTICRVSNDGGRSRSRPFHRC